MSWNLGSSNTIQRRHVAFGAILVFFSIALITAEVKRPSSLFIGYWVGTIGILPSILAIACGIKPSNLLLIFGATSDIISALACVAGAILSLVYFSIHVYAVGWLSVIMTTFLLYHMFALFGELNSCCRFFILDGSESIPDTLSHRHHDIPAPPIGFMMPDEVPKPPDYDQLSVRGNPPSYGEIPAPNTSREPLTPQFPPSPSPGNNPRGRVQTPLQSSENPRTQRRHRSSHRSRPSELSRRRPSSSEAVERNFE